jgi:predicted transcriptional regulator
MPCPSQDITDAELSMLQALWARGELTILEVTEVVYPGATPAQYATVRSLLTRLERKKLVRRSRRGRINFFRASLDRDEVIGRRLKTLADKLCEGSLSPLLTQLVSSVRLSAEERRKLRALLESLDRDAKKEDRGERG